MDRWMYPFSPFLSTISTYTLVDRFPNTKCMITEIPSVQWSENAVLHRPVSFFSALLNSNSIAVVRAARLGLGARFKTRHRNATRL